MERTEPVFTRWNRYKLPVHGPQRPMENLTTGLSSAEAQRIRAQVGPNATPDVAIHPVRLVLSKFLAPVSVLLEIAIVLQLALGEYVEGAIIGSLLIFNTAIGFFHEGRAQSTIAALKSRLALNASVMRDGAWTICPAAELVPGDVVKLTLGTVVAADVLIREGSILLDQSMLTGKSLPVEAGPGTETYAGALVRRGEAVAEVRATGMRTKFGRTAELVRTAYVVSTQQKAVFRVVRNLAGFNGAVTLLLMVYAYEIGMPLSEVIPLVLISVLASVPIALPATFTLATAIGARALTRAGVLPTRLSAVDEAASLDVLCIDKTGTLTRNELAVAAIHAMPGFDEDRVLMLAALASADGGQDPVDAAVRVAAALHDKNTSLLKITRFVPFDPAIKMSEAHAVDRDGNALHIVKGAFAVVHGISQPSPEAELIANELEKHGHRVLGVAIGTDGAMRVAGIVALSDPPRSDSKPMTIVGITLGLFDLFFCVGLLSFGLLVMHLDIDTLRTMTLVTLAFNGQAVFYVVRERRRLWSSRPSLLVIVSSILDILLIATLALAGVLMAPLAPSIVAGILAAAIVLALMMDQVKGLLFTHFRMA